MKEVLCPLNRNMSNNVSYFEVRFKAGFSCMRKLIFALQTDYVTLLCANKSTCLKVWYQLLVPLPEAIIGHSWNNLCSCMTVLNIFKSSG